MPENTYGPENSHAGWSALSSMADWTSATWDRSEMCWVDLGQTLQQSKGKMSDIFIFTSLVEV
jgi:hypothetical protein